MELKILKYYEGKSDGIEHLSIEADKVGSRPAWVFIKNPDFKARFISIRTATNSEELYKRFTGNFYYPLDYTPKEEKRFYAKYAQFYDQNTARNNLPMAEFILGKMLKIGVLKNSKILDLGSGTGLFSDLASQKGYKDLTLLDISEEMLNEARKKPSLSTSRFIVGDVAEIELDESFDIFVSIMMFDNLDDKKLLIALNKLLPALKKSGLIFLIEDKHRKEYDKYFKNIESGMFTYLQKDGYAKYYFIGKKI